MTDEVRRYIIFEHYYHRRKFKEIADELEMKKQTISNDHRRHREIWEKEKKWLELLLKDKLNKGFSKSIEESRADLRNLHCRIDELEEHKSKLSDALENNAITPEDFVKFVKQNQEIENVLVNAEIRMCIWLTQELQRKQEIRQSPVEHLKDIVEKNRSAGTP